MEWRYKHEEIDGPCCIPRISADRSNGLYNRHAGFGALFEAALFPAAAGALARLVLPRHRNAIDRFRPPAGLGPNAVRF